MRSCTRIYENMLRIAEHMEPDHALVQRDIKIILAPNKRIFAHALRLIADAGPALRSVAMSIAMAI